MLDVGGCQSQSLDLAQLPVQRLGGDEVSQTGEGGVDTLGSVSLPHVGDDPRLLWSCWSVPLLVSTVHTGTVPGTEGPMFVARLPHPDCSHTAGSGVAQLSSHLLPHALIGPEISPGAWSGLAEQATYSGS